VFIKQGAMINRWRNADGKVPGQIRTFKVILRAWAA
jgi:hypothetical protein